MAQYLRVIVVLAISGSAPSILTTGRGVAQYLAVIVVLAVGSTPSKFPMRPRCGTVLLCGVVAVRLVVLEAVHCLVQDRPLTGTTVGTMLHQLTPEHGSCTMVVCVGFQPYLTIRVEVLRGR